MWPAVLGTVVLTVLLTIVALPFGVIAALYLREYAKQGPLVSAVSDRHQQPRGRAEHRVRDVRPRASSATRSGDTSTAGRAPAATGGWWWAVLGGNAGRSVVACGVGVWSAHAGKEALGPAWAAGVGVGAPGSVTGAAWWSWSTPYFGGFFARSCREGSPTFGGRGMLWASLTLALLTLPVVIVSTEEAIAAVPNSMREGSYGCGASRWQTVRRSCCPGRCRGS